MKSRNPVFALEMIQTSFAAFGAAPELNTVAIQYSPWR